jgi:hypothetical protein
MTDTGFCKEERLSAGVVVEYNFLSKQDVTCEVFLNG